ncbi:acryloyl-CoA reductase [Alicyclobacillus acidoterrestris]|uniref:acrylyl-CoA reductase family protein n=1 Tax=Alicyclobacillus acidoterrestris TaxID=1450 RepID=UPI003F530ED7
MNSFRALVVDYVGDEFTRGVQTLTLDQLPEGDVTIRVMYSSVNYKDGMASVPNSRIVHTYPFVPGIDLAGYVVHSDNPRFREGDEVIATGYGLGVSHFGGFSEMARVPADWLVPLPKGLTLKEAMALGTAGFTAALSIYQMQHNGVHPAMGEILVTGATGGVGSLAINMLSKLGYDAVASTRQQQGHEYLYALGAKAVIAHDTLTVPEGKSLLRQRWSGAIDAVGGQLLAYLLSTVKYGGSVALSGMTAGTEFTANVYPFILCGVNLLGIDSVSCPMEKRARIWSWLASDLKSPDWLATVAHETTLDDLPNVLSRILDGEIRGRVIVSMA